MQNKYAMHERHDFVMFGRLNKNIRFNLVQQHVIIPRFHLVQQHVIILRFDLVQQHVIIPLHSEPLRHRRQFVCWTMPMSYLQRELKTF